MEPQYKVKPRYNKKRTYKKKRKRNKEKQKGYTLNWIVNKYKTGDLDLSKTGQRIAYENAVKKGLIPKEEDDE